VRYILLESHSYKHSPFSKFYRGIYGLFIGSAQPTAGEGKSGKDKKMKRYFLFRLFRDRCFGEIKGRCRRNHHE
jgi:hypothetical protein